MPFVPSTTWLQAYLRQNKKNRKAVNVVCDSLLQSKYLFQKQLLALFTEYYYLIEAIIDLQGVTRTEKNTYSYINSKIHMITKNYWSKIWGVIAVCYIESLNSDCAKVYILFLDKLIAHYINRMAFDFMNREFRKGLLW